MMNYWHDRSNREKIFLGIAGVFILLFLFFEMIFFPLLSAISNQQQEITQNRNTIALMEKAKPLLLHNHGQQVVFQAISQQALLSTIDEFYSQNGLKKFAGNLSQSSDGSVSVTSKGIPFDLMMSMILKLWQQHHVKILTLQANPSKVQGTADVTIRLGIVN